MKKNIYLSILTVITVLCIIGGSCYHLMGWGASLIGRFLPEGQESAGSIVSSNATELGEFSSISIDANVMDLTIVPGDNATLSFKGNSKLAPKYEVKGDTLVITQDSIRNLMGNKNCSVTITLPQDAYYEQVEIISDVGDIDISGMRGARLTLDAAVGDMDLDSCDFEEMELIADVGDADVTDCNFSRLNVDNSVGDIDVDSASDLSEYTIDLSTDVGEVEVNEKSYRRSYSQDGEHGKNVTLSNSTGDISLSYE